MGAISPRSFLMPTTTEIAGSGPISEQAMQTASGMMPQFQQMQQRGQQMQQSAAGEQRKQTDWDQLQELTKDQDKAKEAFLATLEQTPEGRELMQYGPLKELGIEPLRGLKLEEIFEVAALSMKDRETQVGAMEKQKLERGRAEAQRAMIGGVTTGQVPGEEPYQALTRGYQGLKPEQQLRLGKEEVGLAEKFTKPPEKMFPGLVGEPRRQKQQDITQRQWYAKNTEKLVPVANSIIAIDSALKDIGAGGIYGSGDIPGVGFGTKLYRKWLNGDDAVKVRQAIQMYFLGKAKEQSGVAITPQEMERIEAAFGLNKESTVDSFRESMKIGADQLRLQYKQVEGGIDPDFLQTLKNEGGMLFSESLPTKAGGVGGTVNYVRDPKTGKLVRQ